MNKINEALKELEASHKRSIALAQSVDAQMLTAQFNDSWSMIQVFVHLNESESGAVVYIKKKLQSENLKNAGFGTKLRSVLLMAVLKSPFKFKIPSVLAQPANDASIEVLSDSFKQNIIELKGLIGVLGTEKLGKEIFKHPVLGRLSFYQTINFLTAHFDRHHNQLLAIKGRLK